MRHLYISSVLALLSLTLVSACGGDEGVPADQIGVGAECTAAPNNCPEVDLGGDAGVQQLECLTNFAGGYCGLNPCGSSADCPVGSICVLHTDAQTYCFRSCIDKSECNVNRSVDVESNCSSNFTWQVSSESTSIGGKACIPPSSGI